VSPISLRNNAIRRFGERPAIDPRRRPAVRCWLRKPPGPGRCPDVGVPRTGPASTGTARRERSAERSTTPRTVARAGAVRRLPRSIPSRRSCSPTREVGCRRRDTRRLAESGPRGPPCLAPNRVPRCSSSARRTRRGCRPPRRARPGQTDGRLLRGRLPVIGSGTADVGHEGPTPSRRPTPWPDRARRGQTRRARRGPSRPAHAASEPPTACRTRSRCV
jgi:hypothetical protein